MRSGGSVKDRESARDIRLSLVTLGDPNQQTGGYRYHRMMVQAAHAHGAEMRSFSIPALAWPLGILPAARTVRAASARSDGILLDSIVAALAAPWMGRGSVPFAAVVHQRPGGVDQGTIRSRAQRALDRLAYRHATGVVAAAESLVEDIRSAGVPAQGIRVVPPGCDVPVAAGPRLDLRRGRRAAVLCVANWLPSKGILELLDAFSSLPEDAATLWLVGSHEANRAYAARVHRRISSADLSRRVVVVGPVPIEEVGRLYRSADVFAMCSTVDAYGTVWAEAIAAGLPVVGWRAANLPRLAEHGREALMPEPGDRRGLAEALRTLTTDAAVRDRFAAAARRRAETLPTWDGSARLFFDAVRDLLTVDPRRASSVGEE
jgi:glycosyltransferase involved in cell wall biosynthesis